MLNISVRGWCTTAATECPAPARSFSVTMRFCAEVLSRPVDGRSEQFGQRYEPRTKSFVGPDRCLSAALPLTSAATRHRMKALVLLHSQSRGQRLRNDLTLKSETRVFQRATSR
mmetsp:Transcript_34259/g.102649  ORF Transcript_34259/g.102649 Transcript_34259/m.102649 type:complete len:114 (+) Transcript_34259:324-665(+)